jgi:hypothetical protein
MDGLIKSLPQVLRLVGASPEVTEAAVMAAWKHAAGEGLRHHAVPLRLEGRTLVVAIPDAIWQKQLTPMKGQLLFRVNSILGQPLLTHIELRIDPKATNTRPALKSEPADVPDNEVPLDLWSAASAIEDKNLRQTFIKAAVASMKRRENER